VEHKLSGFLDSLRKRVAQDDRVIVERKPVSGSGFHLLGLLTGFSSGFRRTAEIAGCAISRMKIALLVAEAQSGGSGGGAPGKRLSREARPRCFDPCFVSHKLKRSEMVQFVEHCVYDRCVAFEICMYAPEFPSDLTN
jgi:hypothetical protein